MTIRGQKYFALAQKNANHSLKSYRPTSTATWVLLCYMLVATACILTLQILLSYGIDFRPDALDHVRRSTASPLTHTDTVKDSALKGAAVSNAKLIRRDRPSSTSITVSKTTSIQRTTSQPLKQTVLTPLDEKDNLTQLQVSQSTPVSTTTLKDTRTSQTTTTFHPGATNGNGSDNGHDHYLDLSATVQSDPANVESVHLSALGGAADIARVTAQPVQPMEISTTSGTIPTQTKSTVVISTTSEIVSTQAGLIVTSSTSQHTDIVENALQSPGITASSTNGVVQTHSIADTSQLTTIPSTNKISPTQTPAATNTAILFDTTRVSSMSSISNSQTMNIQTSFGSNSANGDPGYRSSSAASTPLTKASGAHNDNVVGQTSTSSTNAKTSSTGSTPSTTSNSDSGTYTPVLDQLFGLVPLTLPGLGKDASTMKILGSTFPIPRPSSMTPVISLDRGSDNSAYTAKPTLKGTTKSIASTSSTPTQALSAIPSTYVRLRNPGPMSSNQYFAIEFIPKVLAVVMAAIWSISHAGLKLIEPFIEMSSGKDTLLAGYLSSDLSWSSLADMFKGRWLLFFSNLVGLSMFVIVALVDEALTVAPTALCKTLISDHQPCEPALYANGTVVHVIQGLLSLVVISLVMVVVLVRRNSGVFSDPSKLATLATLLGNDHFRQSLSETNISRFQDRGFHIQDGHQDYRLVGNGEPAIEKTTFPRKPGMIWFEAGTLSLTLLLFSMILAYLFLHQGSFNSFMNSSTFAPGFVLSILGLLVTFGLKSIERRERISEVYTRMTTPQDAEDSILMSLGGTPYIGVFSAFLHRWWFVSSVSVATILADFMQICLSGIPFADGDTFTSY